MASVKPAPPAGSGDMMSRGGPETSDPGQVTYERTWLRNVVADAYAVRIDQVSGPEWVNTAAYTIVAKIPTHTTRQQFREMLQTLLAERFRMTLHHETKTVPVYVLSYAGGRFDRERYADDGGVAGVHRRTISWRPGPCSVRWTGSWA